MSEDYSEKKPKRKYEVHVASEPVESEPSTPQPETKPKNKLQELFEQRPNFYGGEQPAEMMDKIRQLHKFYENLRELL